jgi:ribulose-5-phosphate 4-epimerase/fuculose-1-phosphate aldolase
VGRLAGGDDLVAEFVGLLAGHGAFAGAEQVADNVWNHAHIEGQPLDW